MYLRVNSGDQSFPSSELDNAEFRHFSLSWWAYLVLNHCSQNQYWVQAYSSSITLCSCLINVWPNLWTFLLSAHSSYRADSGPEWMRKTCQPDFFCLSKQRYKHLVLCICWILNALQPILLNSTGVFQDDYKNNAVENSSRKNISYRLLQLPPFY